METPFGFFLALPFFYLGLPTKYGSSPISYVRPINHTGLNVHQHTKNDL